MIDCPAFHSTHQPGKTKTYGWKDSYTRRTLDCWERYLKEPK